MKTVWRLKYLVVLGALVVLGTAGGGSSGDSSDALRDKQYRTP